MAKGLGMWDKKEKKEITYMCSKELRLLVGLYFHYAYSWLRNDTV